MQNSKLPQVTNEDGAGYALPSVKMQKLNSFILPLLLVPEGTQEAKVIAALSHIRERLPSLGVTEAELEDRRYRKHSTFAS